MFKLPWVEHRSDFDDFTRITLLSLFGFRVVLHIFKKDDQHPYHDHPYNLLSILLWGRYEELTPAEYSGYYVVRRTAPSIWWIPARRAHRIRLVQGRRAVTLCFFGRKHRTWGFYVGGNWVESKRYLDEMKETK